ncbi:hypothetical protein D0A34_15720 [Microcoleus vaginatus PCC 9802]|uniref:hypothetical protein n=1 Tax=Microcoleus vaginatus TaxID=119532 RepID=UPI00020D1692|nr:hypothetical protein MicvaDRAFT_3803 [Microcoleus vaginatus FGP-2]UNU20135.1 hypothetical protein D0A34_15720 [Microcoleus vaginatus PCC 9802]
MTLHLLDKIGNWNPQLFREIKGRLNTGNMAIASAFSLSAQVLLFKSVSAQIPVPPPNGSYTNPIYHRFCLDDAPPYERICVRDAFSNFVINWPMWWLEIFTWLSIFSVLALLVAGTYLLVSDLDKEERRGTLNFIRLSPQSAKTIFIGKILGVPILLYLAAILTVPLHLYSGLAAQIPLNEIVCFYPAVAASCALFYSGAMLFGLTTSWLGGFQPWLASAMVFVVFGISWLPLTRTAVDVLHFLSPLAMLRYPLSLVDKTDFDSLVENLDKLQWFYSPVGTNIAIGLALSLLVCGTGTYWMWQGWQRRFPNPSATVLSKRQSYLLVICCQVIFLGFALQSDPPGGNSNLICLLILNLVMFLALIAALTSDRQSLYDWARYRKQIVPSNQKLWRRYPLLDLIWSDKSPAVVAISINFLSSVIILTPWALLEKSENNGFGGVILCLNLILIYAAITQLFLFTKTRNQEIWAACTVGSAILLPPVIFSMLLLTPEKAPFLWLSSTFGLWFSPSLTAASGNTFLLSLLSQWTVLVLLNLKLRSQLKLAGESASKALLKA